MKRTLAPIVLIGILALAGCGSNSDSKQEAPPSTSAEASPAETTIEPTEETAGGLLDGIAEMDKMDDTSYEENGYDTALPAIEVHADKNSGVDFDGLKFELKAAERIPADQVTGITDAYEGYDGLTPIRLTFSITNDQKDVGPFQLQDPDVTGFYGENLQPLEQYSTYEDNDGGPKLDDDGPRQVAAGSHAEIMRTLWIPEEAEGEELMAEIVVNPDFFWIDYFIPADQITDL